MVLFDIFLKKKKKKKLRCILDQRSKLCFSFDAQAEIQKSWTESSLGVPADNYITQIV